jgi:hypothetical protein
MAAISKVQGFGGGVIEQSRGDCTLLLIDDEEPALERPARIQIQTPIPILRRLPTLGI